MPNRVGTGWRHGIRWTVVGVYRDGMYVYEFHVERRTKGAYRA